MIKFFPKLSIIMPVYNGQPFIKESLDSILNQTFKDFELIIIDDGSLDNSFEIAEEYARADDRVRLFSNEENKNIVYSLNKGLKKAQSNYIARMDCGDIASKNRLEKQYKHLISNNIILVGSQAYFINNKNQIVSKSNYPCDDIKIKKELFLKNNVILHPAAMFKWNSYLFYRELAFPAEDYDLWLRLAHLGKFEIINEPLMTIRLNPHGISFSKLVKQKNTIDIIHKLLIERLKYDKEMSTTFYIGKASLKNCQKLTFIENLYQEIIRIVISNKKGTLKWLIFAVLSHILYPRKVKEKIVLHFKRKLLLIKKDHLFHKLIKSPVQLYK